MTNYTIRNARKEDAIGILALIRELATFEKAAEKVEISLEELETDGFGPNPAYQAFVAETEGELIGFTLSFIRYSTWRGKILYVEDLYVKDAFRGQSVGSALLESQMAYARSLNLRFLCFQVLDWNTRAIGFYNRYPVEFDAEWVNGLISVLPSS